MKKRLIAIGLMAMLVLTATIAAFATTPSEILGEIKGIESDEVRDMAREQGKTIGELASEEGVLEQFKDAMLESKIEIIEQRVEEGNLTREEADEIIALLKDSVANCDGTGNGDRLGQKYGVGFGKGNANNQYGTRSRGRQSGSRGNGRGLCVGMN